MDRRDFLSDLTRAAALCAVVPNVWRVDYRPRLVDNPFTLGVASGDPTATGGVLWTRLATKPIEPDGGMDGKPVVTWEVADDDGFKKIVKTGRATAAPELSYSIHVNVDGLEPDRWYFYRFQVAQAMSPIGRFRTSPADGVIKPLTFAVASCQRWDQGLWTAYEHMAKEELDLVTHLGDYIYEGSSPSNAVRMHQGLEIRTLDDYRRRYAQYKSDPALQAAHHKCPWIVTWDDHEVDNNYAGLVGENEMESVEQMRARRAAGYQAWWEHQPVKVPRATSWADLTITRTINWGALARFWMLDTRQYRDDQACGDGTKTVPCGEWANPARGLMGAAQEKWLYDGLGASKSRWQVIGNQVMMAPYDSGPGAEVRVSMDQWSGYPVARDRLLGNIAQRAPNRTVVITGDIHTHWVNELRSDFSRPDRPVIAAEFVGTSISSDGDGSGDPNARMQTQLQENPHVKFFQSRRGYFTCRVSETEWQTDYRSVPYVTKPGAPLEVPSRWRLEHGRAGIQKL